MKALMIRVGIDSGKNGGRWNAPCNPKTDDFVYVPVPAGDRCKDSSLNRYYDKDITKALDEFSQRNHCHDVMRLPKFKRFERWVKNESAHLDPDFRKGYLSYGNSVGRRAEAMLELERGDFVIFYNSMNPIKKLETGKKEYGIIGILKVQTVKEVNDCADERFKKRNIHTRYPEPEQDPTDVVVYGLTKGSGRLEKYLPIGQWVNGSGYHLREDLKNQWGGVSHEYIQRAQNPIRLSNPQRFFDWWAEQAPQPRLIQRNNL